MDIQYNDNLTYGRGYVYSLQYHIVWCTKYRQPVLTGEVEHAVREELQSLAERYKFTVTAMEIMPDHVHLLIDCSPQFNIPDMLRVMKGVTARRLFLRTPEIKTRLWGGHLWNPSYCVVTVSDRTERQVRSYIESQKTK